MDNATSQCSIVDAIRKAYCLKYFVSNYTSDL